MGGLAAQIVSREQPVASKLPLQAQIPVLGIHRTHIKWIVDVDAIEREECVCTARSWERQRELWNRTLAHVRIRYRCAGTNLWRKAHAAAIRRIVGVAVEVIHLRAVIEQAIAGANAHIAMTRWIPHQSHSGRELQPLVVGKRAGSAWIAAVSKSRGRIGKYGAVLVRQKRGIVEVAAAMRRIDGRPVRPPTYHRMDGDI